MEMTKTFALICAAAMTFFIVVAVHYLPWQLILKKPLPRITAFVLGMLAIGVPFSGLFLTDSTWLNAEILRSFWVLCAVAGVATLSCHGLDAFLRNRLQADETAERERSMLKKVSK